MARREAPRATRSGRAAATAVRRLTLALTFAAQGLALLATGPAHALDLQAHRGGRALMPENTLPAFAHALSIGVTTLELDLGITRDGVVVITHDPDLNPAITRGPDGAFLRQRGPLVRDMGLAELQRHDVGRIDPASRYAASFPDQRPVDGTPIPRLADLFALVARAGADGVRFNIETKLFPHRPEATVAPEDFARAVIAQVRAAGVQARTTIQSFDWRTLRVVQAEAPEIATAHLTAQQRWLDNVGANSPEPSAWTAGLRLADHGSVPALVRAAGGRTWSPFHGDLNPDLVKQAKALGLKVLPWTVNEADDMRRLIDWGVDGLITDRPDRLREVMAQRGLPLPPAVEAARLR
jgi:glycerophosphoryl diester phosphodiesterase